MTRWFTAVVFLLAGMALLLPVASLRVDLGPEAGTFVEVTYTGIDAAVAGFASYRVGSVDAADVPSVEEGSSPFLPASDPFARAAVVLTLLLLVAGAATPLLSGPARPAAALTAALLATITVTAAVMWTGDTMVEHKAVREFFGPVSADDHLRYRYGFWTVLGLLTAVALANSVALRARPTVPTPP